MLSDSWSWVPLFWLDTPAFDWLELGVSALLPLAIVYLGMKVHEQNSKKEQQQWVSQQVIQKRIEVMSEMAPKCNALYCYLTWKGGWKEMSPPDVIALKREIGELYHVNRYIFSPKLNPAYKSFSDACFAPYQGAGRDARIRTQVLGSQGDRKEYFGKEWREDWGEYFTEEDSHDSARRVSGAYRDLMLQFRAELEEVTSEVKVAAVTNARSRHA